MNSRSNAIVTATWQRDFERCAILCETIDRYATGYDCHYLLIDEIDRPLFRALEGPKRRLISDLELLPWWFRRLPLALSPQRRRVWISAVTRPLHGWHVQQLKRIAVARLVSEDALFFCDSDTAFVRPYDLSRLWKGDDLRLYRLDHGAPAAQSDHMEWIRHAGETLGLAPARLSDHDYVGSFIAWRRQAMVDMCEHIERVHGRSWITVIGRSRRFSECMIYGAYVDGVLEGKGVWHDSQQLCAIHWCDPAPTDAEMALLVEGVGETQAGIGVQSFVPMEPGRFRRFVLGDDGTSA